jgi:hypothetical protein
MKVIFAGKFESALIRSIDAELLPSRNQARSGYYSSLNRHVPKSYFDRCGTFIAIAESVPVPSVDWGYPNKENRGHLSGAELGIEATEAGGGEWDDDTEAFVELILKKRVLSASSKNYISNLTVTHLSKVDRTYVNANLKKIRGEAARHYLCRLFLQLRAARDETAYLVLSEEDIQIIEEVGNWVMQKKFPTPFDLPDLAGLLIEPESFSAGLLNFSPPDILSVSAVRSDKHIRAYARKVTEVLAEPPPKVANSKSLLRWLRHTKKQRPAPAQKRYLKPLVGWSSRFTTCRELTLFCR